MTVPEPSPLKPDYGNWVSSKYVFTLAASGVTLAFVALLAPVLFLPAIILLGMAAYSAYARFKFSERGGDLQSRIRTTLLDHLVWEGKGTAIDIGCGNGAMTILLARKYPDSLVTGIDSWGKSWEYSQAICEKNAEAESVGGRTSFVRGSASGLPFEEGSFDVAVSNLAFHEVRDIADKRAAIREALRVLKKGGEFAFQDLFMWKRLFGTIDDLLLQVRSWGVEHVEFTDTSRSEFIPKALKLRFMVGTIGILHGKK